jgi:hypothetical protein
MKLKAADDVAVITIVGEASDNPQTYTLDALITDRPETNAKVVWTVAEDWDLWGTYKSADISPIVQELVNRPGWQSGNAMAFMHSRARIRDQAIWKMPEK